MRNGGFELTVISLHQRLKDQFIEAWDALNECGFRPEMIDDIVSRLLRKDRIDLIKRVVMFIATGAEAGVDLDRMLLVDFPSGWAVRRTFQKAAGSRHVRLTDSEATLIQRCGSGFTTRFASTPRLICATRLITEMLGFERYMNLIIQIDSAGRVKDALALLARDLSNEIDRFRQIALGSSHDSRKGKHLLNWLREDCEANSLGPLDIDADQVLRFWVENCENQSINIKQYRSAHELFVGIVAVLGEAIRHQGEIHERDLERELPEALPHDDWMKLRAENADIKVLPGKGFEDIAFLADLTPTASRLLLSALRLTTIGPVDARVSHTKEEAAYKALWKDAASLEVSASSLADKAGRFREASLASLHLLLRHQKIAGIYLAHALFADLREMAEISEEDLAGVNPDDKDAIDAMQLALLNKISTSDAPYFVKMRSDAERAWKAVERAGFHNRELDNEFLADRHDTMAPRLIGALSHIESRASAIAEIARRHGDDEEALRLFDQTFRRLYGYTPIEENT